MLKRNHKASIIQYEQNLWKNDFRLIAGVDEVGRGPFAGPLVASAVVWDENFILKNWENKHSDLHNIKDSKKLTEKQRIKLADFIKENCKEFSIIEIPSKEIDINGVGEVNKTALLNAINQLLTKPDYVLIDYFKLDNELKIPNASITKGDSLSLSIASASIIAKVYRDNLMKNKYHKLYPKYGFDTNVGYGTKKHRDAIKEFGLTPIHRKSFIKF